MGISGSTDLVAKDTAKRHERSIDYWKEYFITMPPGVAMDYITSHNRWRSKTWAKVGFNDKLLGAYKALNKEMT